MTKREVKLWHLWCANQEMVKTWFSYQSFGLHSYLYGSAFKSESSKNYALVDASSPILAKIGDTQNKFSTSADSMTCEKYHLQDRLRESFGPFQDSSLAKPVLSTMKEGGSTPVKASLPSLWESWTPLLFATSNLNEVGEASLKWESYTSLKMERNTMHYAHQELSLEALLANDSSPTRNEKAPAGDMDGETRPELDRTPGSPAIKQSSFGLSRDYSFAEESYEDWSFVEKRPYDSLVRESLLDVFNTLEDSSLIESKQKVRPSFLLRQVSNRNDGLHQAQGYSPLEEQLMSDDIQQVYASRLHFQQKVKWFYGLLTTSSLNRHIFPYNTQRGLRSKKLMGFSFLSELEKRFDVQLYRLGWFPTIASARQAIQHKHVGLWTVKDRKNTDSASLPASPGIQIRNSALNYELNKGDIFFFRDKKSTKKTDLLVNHWLQSKLSFTNFYKFPWEIFSSAIKEEVSPVQESGDKMIRPVWLLGNHQSSIQLSSTIVEKTLHSTNETIFSSTAFLTEPSVGNENQFYISGNENTCFANKLSVSSPVASIGTDQIFTGLHLSTSPLWNWSAPNHLEYHCQSFFALYKEHPSWMNTKIPETKDRMQNFKNYMSSHV